MRWTLVVVLVIAWNTTLRSDDEIKALQAVGGGAEGAAEARRARDVLVAGGAENLVPVLQAFRGSSLLASNWLRSTFEAIADQQLQSDRGLPADELLAFIRDTSQSPAARRLAYEWLLKQQPELEQDLIPGMLLDPSSDFRRDAVTRLIDQAKAAKDQAAVEIYQDALKGAVHEDQVKVIAAALRKASVDVDIQKHFGFLTSWRIIGPFNNRNKVGFNVAYPPEKEIDSTAQYDGQLGQVSWQSIETDNDYGAIDIGNQIENYKGSVMYAVTTFQSGKDQQVEIRLGTPNAWKLWVNGELVFQREEYHRGTRMDQYKMPVNLREGSNTILFKICQNEQDESWAQDYKFQLRVCDATGSAVHSSGTAADLSQNTRGSR